MKSNHHETHSIAITAMARSPMSQGAAGVADTGYGMGCAVGDYNNDGFPDLYVTNFGANVFFRNNGDGTFTDVTTGDRHRGHTLGDKLRLRRL